MMEEVNRFVELQKRKRELEEMLDECKNLISVAEHKILEVFQEHGVNNISTEYGTVYLSSKTYFQPSSKETALKFLKERFPEIVRETYDTRTLSKMARELKEGGNLPEDFYDYFNEHEVFGVMLRRK